MANFLTKIFGSSNERKLKGYRREVAAAAAFEDSVKALDADALRSRMDALKSEVADGKALDELLPEVFAMVRESAVRTLGMRHFDEQLLGGIALHRGKIAEMRTGEGKTLVATLPACLNALADKGVHIVTVNEYLAQRDADWMRPVYEYLGLSVGVIKSGMMPPEKREAYACDIVYGTNNEFGFDYLRDNLAFRPEDQVQRETFFAVVDEVDSILIDEARTPLIISGPSEERTELYVEMNKLIPKLEVREFDGSPRNEDIKLGKVELQGPAGEALGSVSIDAALSQARADGNDLVQVPDAEAGNVVRIVSPGDYYVDEKSKQAFLTDQGHENVENILVRDGLLAEGDSLYDAANIKLMHHVTAALRAHKLFQKDVDYIVQDGDIVIVDEFTGRTMPGRRWSDGLHQAVEAKEMVAVKEENQTVASITFQNYFRLYEKLSGMTGTADTEAFEFQQIYGLEVVVIPTHRPMIRDDQADLVYLTQNDKYTAIIEDIQECVERGQPVLVGTTSIESSELISGILKKRKIPHEVLNAKQHEREAHIVAQAGQAGAVTIATNMAGRGTDIVLGGNLEVELEEAGIEADSAESESLRAAWQERHDQILAAGGLHIIGTERHESRRIDNQLRGRSGRQGDAGSSRFFLSMEDNLMRIFGDPERTKALLSRVGMREGEAIESGLLTRQIERAQRKVESHNFDIRKQLLEYDDVANDQRRVVYQQRNDLMAAEEISEAIVGIREDVIGDLCASYMPPGSLEEQWDVPGLTAAVESEYGSTVDVARWLDEDEQLDPEGVAERVASQLAEEYASKADQVGVENMRDIEKAIMLQQLDTHWKEHLAAMDYLRQGIGLRGYAQKNPKQEYKREAFEMFGEMLDQVKIQVLTILTRARLRGEQDVEAVEEQRARSEAMQAQHAAAPKLGGDAPAAGPVAQPGAQPSRARQPQAAPVEQFVREQPKVGRNAPCPCGSGKKYKHCHGKLA